MSVTRQDRAADLPMTAAARVSQAEVDRGYRRFLARRGLTVRRWNGNFTTKTTPEPPRQN